MSSFFNPFSRSRGGNAWFTAGLTSSFPNITADDGENIAHVRPCNQGNDESRGGKVFYVPKEDSASASQVVLEDSDAPPGAGGLRDQVLVFQYKEKFHAINHVSHSTASSCEIKTSLIADLTCRNVPTHHIRSPTARLLTSRTLE